jgi:hypothetical protein
VENVLEKSWFCPLRSFSPLYSAKVREMQNVHACSEFQIEFFAKNLKMKYRKPSDVAPWRNSKMENFGGLLLSYFKDSKSEFF